MANSITRRFCGWPEAAHLTLLDQWKKEKKTLNKAHILPEHSNSDNSYIN